MFTLSLVIFNEATVQERCDIHLNIENYLAQYKFSDVKYHEINVVTPDYNLRLQKSYYK